MRNVMRYMLFHQQQKNSVPVKRQELTNIILKNNKGGKAAKNLGGRIIKRVAWEFVKRFGMEMKGIETKRSTIHGEGFFAGPHICSNHLTTLNDGPARYCLAFAELHCGRARSAWWPNLDVSRACRALRAVCDALHPIFDQSIKLPRWREDGSEERIRWLH